MLPRHRYPERFNPVKRPRDRERRIPQLRKPREAELREEEPHPEDRRAGLFQNSADSCRRPGSCAARLGSLRRQRYREQAVSFR